MICYSLRGCGGWGALVNVKGKNRRLPLQQVAARYEMHIAVALLYGCGVSQNCLSSQLPCSVLFFNGGWVFPRSSCGFWNIVEAVAVLQIVAKGLNRLFSFTASVTRCKDKSCRAFHFFLGAGIFLHAHTLLNERVHQPFQIEWF